MEDYLVEGYRVVRGILEVWAIAQSPREQYSHPRGPQAVVSQNRGLGFRV